MKVCMVSKHFHPFPGGLEVRVYELARYMTEVGDEVLVLTSLEKNTKHSETIEKIEVLRSKVWVNIFNALITPGIFKNLLTQNYDLIDVNLPDPLNSLFSYIASKIRNKPLIVTYHADIIKSGYTATIFKTLYQPIQTLVLRKARTILVTSPNYAQQSKTLKPYLGKVEVASSFINQTRYNPHVNGIELKKELCPNNEQMVLFVGRFVPYKGIENLLKAMAKIKSKSKAVLIGDGILKDELIKLSQTLGVSDRVLFKTDVTDEQLPNYYGAADVFTLPSINRAEAFGLVLVEAMACQKPVITSNFSGMPYVVGDEDITEILPGIFQGAGGLLLEPNDPDKLAQAIDKILSDKKLAEKIGIEGEKRVQRYFTKEAVCESVRNVYIASHQKLIIER